jgi:hypothetical protein
LRLAISSDPWSGGTPFPLPLPIEHRYDLGPLLKMGSGLRG